MYHTYKISWYTKYHPSFGTRILHTILGIRLGCHVLSHNMYQYMPVLRISIRLKLNYGRANGSGELCAGDTVCIEKSRSAELTEAINSMYRWYRNFNRGSKIGPHGCAS